MGILHYNPASFKRKGDLYTPINYGYLYNWYTLQEAYKIYVDSIMWSFNLNINSYNSPALYPASVMVNGILFNEAASYPPAQGEWFYVGEFNFLSIRGSSDEDFSSLPDGYVVMIYSNIINEDKSVIPMTMISLGWELPLAIELETLASLVLYDGEVMRENNILYWVSELLGTNIYNFNARGSGRRVSGVGFDGCRNAFYSWCKNSQTPNYYFIASSFEGDYTPELTDGYSIRLFRLATINEELQEDGTSCTNYIGNDGKVYRTVKIGTQVWLADSLAETLYNGLTEIPTVVDNAAWVALTTGAKCAYDNNESNV